MSTLRAGTPTPNETLETPSDVCTPGICALIARIPSIVATARRPPLGVAGRQRERQAVEDQRVAVEPVLVAAQLGDPLRHLELALGGLGHPDLVDRQRDQRRAVGLDDRHDPVELVAAGLEVDAVDDRAARDLLQRGLDHVGLGRVDLDRRRLGQRDALDDPAHLLGLVLALGQRDADVEHVGAAGDLILGDRHQPVVVVGQQHLLGLARALRVDALADQRRSRRLHERRGGDHRADVGRAPGGSRTRPRVRGRARRSRRCAPAWCRSSRRRSRRRSGRRTRRARRPAGRASRGRSSRRSGPAAAARRSGCSGPAPS